MRDTPLSPSRLAFLQEEWTLDPHARAESVWYRVAGLASRNQRDMGVRIIEAEIRSGQYEVLLEAARLALTDTTPIEIARQLRERAERLIRPPKTGAS
jgi:hypothetical protein